MPEFAIDFDHSIKISQIERSFIAMNKISMRTKLKYRFRRTNWIRHSTRLIKLIENRIEFN